MKREKLPEIDVNRKYIKLKLKLKEKTEGIKLDKKILFHPNKIKFNLNSLVNNYKFKSSKSNNLKSISLTRLAFRKKLSNININQSFLSRSLSKKSIYNSNQSNNINKNLVHNTSTKFITTKSLLERLSPGNFDELEKYEYYNKIESSKIYQEFLKKEKEMKHKNKISSSFFEDSFLNTKNKEEEKTIKDVIKQKESIYDSLYLFNPKNMLKLRLKFKKKDEFEKYLIEKFVKNKKNHLENKNELNQNKKNIYIILDGDIIINENHIKGVFIEIPFSRDIKLLNKEQKKLIFTNILKKGRNVFNTKKPLINIFSPDKQYLSNLNEIKESYKYLYVSPNILCFGLSIITTRPMMKIYDTDFINKLKENEEKMKENKIFKKKFLNIKHIYKIKEVICGIRPKYEKYKPHYSFAEGENYLENVDYVIYSDDEERKKSKGKKILKNCYLKNDFFLYLNEKDIKKRTDELKKNLSFTDTYNIKTNYIKFKPNFDNLLTRYKKEFYKKLKINPNIFKIDPIESKMVSQNLDLPENKLNNIFISRNSQNKRSFQKSIRIKKPKNNYTDIIIDKSIDKSKYGYNSFYHNLERNVIKYYNPLILYNIPKLLKEFKNFTRERIYELYAKYKDLITMAYSTYKSKFILQNGIDFDTFWRCIETFSDEKKEFKNKIFNQFNRSDVSFLSMEDFLTGMYYMHNSDLSQKLDLFLKMLDKSGKGSISFNEAVNICKESIQRNFGEKDNDDKQDKTALNQMSEFFASFVFQLIGVDKKNNLEIETLRKAIISKENELNEFEYLKMFCGANI